ncbi:hypothetical protein GUITHDRAFT_150964 [Guillardia theta CCMP2712]|uniref:Uncharacterized protein n=1 Tax=Guillardia theta (strain CCMP2712) TaxID=905079 RepID=L1JSH3_GUITC|nr:hypothetical protein GUITHDRAFT_150964 [Guillardia theta CCMP2712]EKX51033.1 hypothetical protein GUITHDRAFT_150964 [Guillardia theta CCMP2712]|eukprot:XP_005838013.1 hypothetical protein GUITHDRAFT_150964 [Guillardia theta CCMP2712]
MQTKKLGGNFVKKNDQKLVAFSNSMLHLTCKECKKEEVTVGDMMSSRRNFSAQTDTRLKIRLLQA